MGDSGEGVGVGGRRVIGTVRVDEASEAGAGRWEDDFELLEQVWAVVDGAGADWVIVGWVVWVRVTVVVKKGVDVVSQWSSVGLGWDWVRDKGMEERVERAEAEEGADGARIVRDLADVVEGFRGNAQAGEWVSW